MKFIKIIENIFFFAAVGLCFWADWRIGFALALYEIARGCEYAREFEAHRGKLMRYIEVALESMLETVGKEQRDKD